MSEDTVISLKSRAPGSVADILTEILRESTQQLLASLIEAEVRTFLQRFQDEKTPEGLVRNGRLPELCLAAKHSGAGVHAGQKHRTPLA